MKIKELERYEIYKDGTIINLIRNKPVKFSQDVKGYMKARLHSNLSKHKDGRKPFRLHRIIARAFLDDWAENLQVNHKDGNKLNNHIDNLEMMTPSQNVYHGWNNLDSVNRREQLSNRRIGEKHSEETKLLISEKAKISQKTRRRNELGQYT